MDEQSILFKLQLTGTEWARFNPTRSCRAHKTGKSRLPRALGCGKLASAAASLLYYFKRCLRKLLKSRSLWLGLVCHRRAGSQQQIRGPLSHTPEMNVRGAILNFNQA
jgi:hypothetical protein